MFDFIEYEGYYYRNLAAQDICKYALFHELADAIARAIVTKRDDIILPSGNSIRFVICNCEPLLVIEDCEKELQTLIDADANLICISDFRDYIVGKK